MPRAALEHIDNNVKLSRHHLCVLSSKVLYTADAGSPATLCTQRCPVSRGRRPVERNAVKAMRSHEHVMGLSEF